MSKWFVFEIKPHAAYEYNYTKDDLRKLHNEVSEWLDTNKCKTAKLQIISIISRAYRTGSIGQGAMSWDDLNETYPAAFLRVKFRSERDATLFKMFYSEYFYENIDFSKILLPLIRRVTTVAIADEIIGVQPMTGPVGAAFAIKAKYPNIKTKKSPFSAAWENVKKEFVKHDG